MPVQLNNRGFDHAKELARQGQVALDERDDWSEHRPSAKDENDFIEHHGFNEYAKWHLGVDTSHPAGTKGHYKFPYGDFTKLHRCGVMAAEVRAGQYKYGDIESAAAHLHGMLEVMK
jgi:hypothetical protein